ncbi:alternative ribosome rescue aminoacyl-tRNA hydrolase ArfB [Kitasatospora aureofaciens]|uniref:Aminoacyl-tRNA hydrolase n=1 Tax=Kitasatospora aureofaciens TaxID=1894 RepID=A0A1E7N786_KITAU|nr:alternative ribosome rescue aminoacyl-tRNA hydrolase ArfB [Kitasatospora aureofaciens]QEV00362.1 aminoacyl-tRNA hydrolase [Streptomyces viridifaciens]ARF79158.1 aminoacyl-tRNA hydrolase [Kitasatospora aureofaciens]OEV36539.1 peptide chain release factor 1 [Kitasatospora aureofaciens]UKZ06585.1 aminoacyl-tRNA hydrolase [Streptomyces viridifaciens]GGU82273.1 aminoacyl-tRNA hydrolase [Kitasatospora aureofaciens]
MSEPIRVRGSVVVPDAELVWRFSRSSGPGGQHVNTSDSKVELRYDVAASKALPEVWRTRALERLANRLVDGRVLVVQASEFRSQWRNREAAAARLAAVLSEACAPPPKARRATRPSRGTVERRLNNKRHRSELKQGRRSPRGE